MLQLQKGIVLRGTLNQKKPGIWQLIDWRDNRGKGSADSPPIPLLPEEAQYLPVVMQDKQVNCHLLIDDHGQQGYVILMRQPVIGYNPAAKYSVHGYFKDLI